MKTTTMFLFTNIFCMSFVLGQDIAKERNLIYESDIYSNFDKVNYNTSYFRKLDSTEILLLKHSFGQDKSYLEKIKQAENYYNMKVFKTASELFFKAILENHNSGRIVDRIKLACSYSMTGKKDSAFVQLFRIAQKGNYMNLEEIENEKYLYGLHKEKEWMEFINIVNENRSKKLDELNSTLKPSL